jgi:hypothetical protein
VWDLVREKHVNKNTLDAKKMIYGAINGMLRATGDPYSYFFDPNENQSFSQDIQGSFEGIGAELADVLYWVLLMSQDFEIDIIDAIKNKLEKNKLKYPVEKSRGKSNKYNEL